MVVDGHNRLLRVEAVAEGHVEDGTDAVRGC